MSAMNPYRTLRQFASDEFIINKSRFIGYAAPCETEAEALAFLQSIRTKHKDATHNCYAYIIGQNAGIMRYSDDGEPGLLPQSSLFCKVSRVRVKLRSRTSWANTF